MNDLGLKLIHYYIFKSVTNYNKKEFYIILTIREKTDKFGHGNSERIETRFYPNIKVSTNKVLWESLVYNNQYLGIPEHYRFDMTRLDTAKAYIKRELISIGVTQRLQWKKTGNLNDFEDIIKDHLNIETTR